MEREITVKLRNYEGLRDQFTQVANSMHKHIPTSSMFSVYFYLCMRYNRNYHYSFPSIANIAEACHLSKRTVSDCIKKLSELEYIEKRNYKSKGNFFNNVYIIRYIDDNDLIEEIINTDEVKYVKIIINDNEHDTNSEYTEVDESEVDNELI